MIYQGISQCLLPYEAYNIRCYILVCHLHPELNVVQNKWLNRIEKQLLNETILNRETFETDAFKNEGGFKKVNAAFGNELDEIIEEINEALYCA